jgi:hypothetical protein
VDLQVLGAEQLHALSKRLKEAGRKDLRRELYKALNRATKPARERVKRDLPTYLPDGYARDLGRDLSLRTRIRGGRDPGVSITAKARKKNREIYRLNRDGELRHPLFGNRRHWFGQQVKPEFFTEPIRQDADQIAAALVEGLGNIADKIAD